MQPGKALVVDRTGVGEAGALGAALEADGVLDERQVLDLVERLELLGGGPAQEDLKPVGEGESDLFIEQLVYRVDDCAGADYAERLDRLRVLGIKLTLRLQVSSMKQKSSMRSRIS